MHLKSSPTEKGHKRGPIRRAIRTVFDYLPRGNTLDDETFRRRHLLLCWVLGLHIPALFAFGLWQGYDIGHMVVEVAPPTGALVFARLARNRRLAAFFATFGLVFCSYLLVHLSAGSIEAHFHFFILIGFIVLYQDWVPLLANTGFTVLSHGVGGVVDPSSVYNHYAAQNKPWLWAGIHGVAVLAACIGVTIFWKNTEIEQHRSAGLASDLAASELAAVQAEAAQRQSVSELFVNLARRNQSLLDRQLALISELEQHENKPEALSDLFQLDHLATRIRRNAESLLVLSGDEPPRLWGRPVPLSETVRAAAAEVEDYPRVEVLVSDYLEVSGRVVADLSHLLAELIENATMFSPPTSGVRVRTHLVPGEGRTFLLSIEDTGIGLSGEQMEEANELLAEPPDVDPRRSTLGFHVVGRLALRLGLRVSLAHTPGGATAVPALAAGGRGHRPGDATAACRQRAPVAGARGDLAGLRRSCVRGRRGVRRRPMGRPAPRHGPRLPGPGLCGRGGDPVCRRHRPTGRAAVRAARPATRGTRAASPAVRAARAASAVVRAARAASAAVRGTRIALCPAVCGAGCAARLAVRRTGPGAGSTSRPPVAGDGRRPRPPGSGRQPGALAAQDAEPRRRASGRRRRHDAGRLAAR